MTAMLNDVLLKLQLKRDRGQEAYRQIEFKKNIR